MIIQQLLVNVMFFVLFQARNEVIATLRRATEVQVYYVIQFVILCCLTQVIMTGVG